MKRSTGLALGGALTLAAVAMAGVGPVKKTALVAIPAQFEVKAPAEKVWKTVSSAEGFSLITGFKVSGADARKSFGAVGDSVNATIWSDKGVLVATQVSAGKELRVSWEPENANYLCHKRFVLKSNGGSTTVQYWDRYTDDQSSVDKTAQDVVKETEKGIKAFQALAEKAA